MAVGVWLIGAIFHPLGVLAPLGVVLLMLAGVAYLLRPKSQNMYWRGRRIDLDEPRGARQRLYHVFSKR